MNPRWWLVLERAQAALPVLVAAGLAGFSWWLVQSSPKEGGAPRPAQVSSSPDYELHQARVARFDAQGRLEAVLDGQAMRHHPSTDTLHIDQLVLSARDHQGQGLHAVSRRGVADHSAEVLTLTGGAQVVAFPAGPRPASPVRFSGEGLRVDMHQRVVSSELPIMLTQDHSQIQAQSMRYTEATGITELGGRVRGRYQLGPAR